ncbi:MAG: hypothetical protein ACXVIT_12385, partial [Halobacteriota archaeon]
MSEINEESYKLSNPVLQKCTVDDHTETRILSELDFCRNDDVSLFELRREAEDENTYEIDNKDYAIQRLDYDLYRWYPYDKPEMSQVATLAALPAELRYCYLEDAYERIEVLTYGTYPDLDEKLKPHIGDALTDMGVCRKRLKYQAVELLERSHNAFLRFRLSLIDDYHYGDADLKTLMLRVAHRIAYDSPSPLIHLDTTGKEGTGKSVLTDTIVTTIPDEFVIPLTSVSPTALYYNSLYKNPETGQKESNPLYYQRKLIIVGEANDSAGWMAIKAFAEANQFKEYEHLATQQGEALRMKVRGARSVWMTSVHGINDAQVLRRFVHCSVDKETDDLKRDKAQFITDNFIRHRSIRSDSRLAVVHEATRLLWSHPDRVTFAEPSAEARELMTYLASHFAAKAGYSTTSTSQFYTLCEVTAYEKRFQQGREWNVCRIEVEDVLEGWYLFSRFEDLTKSNLTAVEIDILRTIYELIERFKRDHEFAYPTASDIIAEGMSQGSVNRALRRKQDFFGAQGKLIELGYVVYEMEWRPSKDDPNYNERVTVFRLTPAAYVILEKKPLSIKVDDHNYPAINGKTYEPINPRCPQGEGSAARDQSDEDTGDGGDGYQMYVRSFGFADSNTDETGGIVNEGLDGIDRWIGREDETSPSEFQNSAILEERNMILSPSSQSNLSPLSSVNNGILESEPQVPAEPSKTANGDRGAEIGIPPRWTPRVIHPCKVGGKWVSYIEVKAL